LGTLKKSTITYWVSWFINRSILL